MGILMLYYTWIGIMRITKGWEDWSCEEMKRFALEFKDEAFTDVQRTIFHNDLSFCLR